MRIEVEGITFTQSDGLSRNLYFDVSGQDKHQLFANMFK